LLVSRSFIDSFALWVADIEIDRLTMKSFWKEWDIRIPLYEQKDMFQLALLHESCVVAKNLRRILIALM